MPHVNIISKESGHKLSMMLRRKRGKPKKQKDLENLSLLISQLDGMRGFRRVQPEVIKDAFKNMRSKDLEREWKKIRHDVEKIVYLPLTIQGLPTLIRLAMISKLIIPISLILTVLAIAPKMHRFLPIPLPPIFGQDIVLIFFMILSIVTANGFIITDFIIRRKIVKYEKEHKQKFSKGRERIKDVTQRLILELVEKLKRRGGDPADYKMKFFFKDYRGIKVIKESRGRIFKKKYFVYTVICST